MPDSNPHTRNTMDYVVYSGNKKDIIPVFTEFMSSEEGRSYIIHLEFCQEDGPYGGKGG